MSILATVQNHVLGIENFNEVYPECEQFSADWEDIGCYLGITKATVSIIKEDNSGAKKRLSGLIAAWLKRDGVNQPLPTWRMLCKAIARVDRNSAEEIARKHQCHCDKCTPDDTGTEDVDQVPTSTTLARRTLKHSKPIKKDVLRDYHSDICTRLNISPETLKSFAGKLFTKRIIDQQTRLSVDRTGGQSGASTLLDHIEMKVEQSPKFLNVVLGIMESEANLRDIVKKIKGESDSEDEETVPSDTKTVPTDYRTDNRKHERGRDDHANINNANDHITDNGSKSTYKVFWGMLGVAILVGIIAIACFYGSGFLYEVPPVTQVSEASSGISSGISKRSVLPSSTETKGKKEALKTTSSTQDSMKDVKDEPLARLKILRHHHHKLCEILDSSEPTFRSLTMNLFSKEIIDANTKNYLLEKVGLGADKLLDHVEKKVEAKPERMDVVLQIMDKEESLQDIVEEIRKDMSDQKQ